jgi:hypothetical protein
LISKLVNKMKPCLILLIMLLLPYSSIGQNSLANIRGSGTVEISNITPEEAKIQAIKLAKVDALNKAGVPELFSDFSSLRKIQNHNDFRQEFHQIMTSEVIGFVESYEVISDSLWIDRDQNIFKDVSIIADVIKFDLDASWFSHEAIKISGIQSSYSNNSKLSFSIKFLSDGYVAIFLTNDTEVQRIYPNKYEIPRHYYSGTEQQFPRDPGIDYRVSTIKNIELNTLIVIFSKEELIIDKSVQFDELLEFVAKLNPNKRKIQVIDFTIRKNEKN